MKKIILLIVILVLFGCTKTIYVPVTNTVTNTEYRDRLQRDSIYLKDSIHIIQRGDTIFLSKVKYYYRNIFVRDTVSKLDSIYIEKPIPIETTKEVYKLTKWQTWRLKLLNLLVVVLLLITLWKFRKPALSIMKKVFGF